MSSWPEMTFAEAGVELFDCDHQTPEFYSDGLPYVTIPQMRDGELDLNNARLISETDFTQWTRKTAPQTDDIVLSRRCNPGETAIVRKGMKFALGQNLVLLRSINTEIYPPYLRWMVQGPEWWNQVGKFLNHGAVFESLKCRDVPNFLLPVPPREQQAMIADLLSALDDKIVLNRRVAETASELARGLYKSWFVDFDPVRRTVGAPSCLPAHLAGLFPSRLTDSGLPEGWEMSRVESVYDIVAGNTPSTEVERYWNGPHAWTTPKDLSRLTTPVVLESDRTLSDAGLDACSSGLLPVGTLLLSSRAPIGYLAFTQVSTAINQGIAAFRRKALSTSFAWAWCHANMALIIASANGSTFLEISKGRLKQLPMIQATEPVMQAFVEMVDPLIARIVNATEQNASLTATRNALLPKLISGDLRIRQVETIAEGV